MPGTGALLAISPLGRLSGAHVDPIVTGGFFLLGTLHRHDLLGSVVAQSAGATAGAAPGPRPPVRARRAAT